MRAKQQKKMAHRAIRNSSPSLFMTVKTSISSRIRYFKYTDKLFSPEHKIGRPKRLQIDRSVIQNSKKI